MMWSRQFALGVVVLLLLVPGCGGEAAPGGGGGSSRSGSGAAEIVCGLACVVVFLAVPAGLVAWLMLRGKRNTTAAGPKPPPARPAADARIFVSYRRTDSQDATGRIYNALVARFSKSCVFKDVDSIPLGEDFRRVLQEAVMRASGVIVVIGPSWLDAQDASGRRRLDDENDFVRIEIETALAQGIPVIPVLVSHATMAAEADLPASLKQLAYRNGLPVRPDPDFHRDIERLVAALQRLAPLGKAPVPVHQSEKRFARPKTIGDRPWLVGCAALALALLIFLVLLAFVGVMRAVFMG